MTVRVSSVAFSGIEAVPVEVEVQKTRGLFGQVSMVGLPGSGVRESRDRVRAAMQASGFSIPRSALIINLAPGDLKKEGSFYDLPVALGILAATGLIRPDAFRKYLILGELGLDGSLRPVPGTLSAAILARESGKRGVLVPPANRREAALVPGIEVLSARDLIGAAKLFGTAIRDTADRERILEGGAETEREHGVPPDRTEQESDGDRLDFSDVLGQESAKEALVAAAAGGHNLLMIGPPGAGKTMLATRLHTILPRLGIKAAIEVSRIHSFARRGLDELIGRPPFRAPHHTISYAGLVGGGQVPRPGEISLAHRGILFLDELPEFGRRTLETLRQPLEQGIITISRAAGSVTLPARISLIASMNPCPCGFHGDGRCQCVCTPTQVQRYLNRISGPILDRLDMHIEVPPVPHTVLRSRASGLSSEAMASLVSTARRQQKKRAGADLIRLNAHMSAAEIREHCPLSPGAAGFLDRQMKKYPLSARGYSRILKVARTLADIEGKDTIGSGQVKRAVMFRSLDRLLPVHAAR